MKRKLGEEEKMSKDKGITLKAQVGVLSPYLKKVGAIGAILYSHF